MPSIQSLHDLPLRDRDILRYEFYGTKVVGVAWREEDSVLDLSLKCVSEWESSPFGTRKHATYQACKLEFGGIQRASLELVLPLLELIIVVVNVEVERTRSGTFVWKFYEVADDEQEFMTIESIYAEFSLAE